LKIGKGQNTLLSNIGHNCFDFMCLNFRHFHCCSPIDLSAKNDVALSATNEGQFKPTQITDLDVFNRKAYLLNCSYFRRGVVHVAAPLRFEGKKGETSAHL